MYGDMSQSLCTRNIFNIALDVPNPQRSTKFDGGVKFHKSMKKSNTPTSTQLKQQKRLRSGVKLDLQSPENRLLDFDSYPH